VTVIALLLTVQVEAAVPDGVIPVLARADTPAQWAETHTDALACDPVWPQEVLVCFRVQEGKKRRFVTAADLARWGVDSVGLRAVVTERARARLATQPVRRTVDGTEKVYFVAAEGDGWSAATVLAPEVVGARLGGPFLLAAPTDQTVLVWLPGDKDLDKIMAVGAKEMFEGADWPVSPVVHQWDGRRFSSFVEAVPAPTPPLGPP
jgi:hypothetical protein